MSSSISSNACFLFFFYPASVTHLSLRVCFFLCFDCSALTAFSHRQPCINSQTHYASVTTLKVGRRDRKDVWPPCKAQHYCNVRVKCARFIFDQKVGEHRRPLLSLAFQGYQIPLDIYPWHPLSGSSGTQESLRQTGPYGNQLYGFSLLLYMSYCVSQG